MIAASATAELGLRVVDGIDKFRSPVFACFPVPSQINSPKVIHQVFGTEVVVVNLETGNYYSVTGSGIGIWQQLDGGVTPAQIAEQFSDPGQASEVKTFLLELEREQLVVPGAASAEATGCAPSRNGTFVRPRLEKFTDMREMLLIDPIHELDENGWPKRAPAPEQR